MTVLDARDDAFARWQEPLWDLAGLIRARADELGDAPYLSFAYGDVRLSFADVDRRSDMVAAGLRDLGVQPGDHVLILLDNRAEFVLTWFALAKLGAVQVPINTAYKGTWLEHVATAAGARLAVVAEELLPNLDPLDLPSLSDVVVVGEDVTSAERRTHRFTGLGETTEPITPHQPRISELAAIHFTSGTTGRSKGARVPLPHMDLLTRRNAQLIDLTPDSVYFTELPLFHINAQMTVQGALIAGARAHIEERFSATQWLDRIRTSGATHTSMLGVMIDFVLSQPPAADETSQALRAVWAAPCVPAAVQSLRERFAIERIVTSYGTTEVGMLARRVVEPGSTDTSSGYVDAEHYEVQVVDMDTDIPVPPGTPGELVVRPKTPWTTMTGDVAMDDRTVEAYRNLWLHAGDCTRFDQEGRLHFVDRLHDRIRRRGENVSSADLEHELLHYPDLIEVAVIPVAAAESGGEDEIKACVVADPSFDAQKFWAWCDERLPTFAVPRYVEVLAELPKTPTEKVLKAPLREAARSPQTLDRGATRRGRS